MDVSPKILRARTRALGDKRNRCKERADGHQSLLRDLYHLMTQTSGLSAPSASIRAGDETPDLQSFLNEHGLWNPNHRLVFDVDFSPALADFQEEEEDVKPTLRGTTPTTIVPKQAEPPTGSRPSPRSQTPIPARRQRVTPARAIAERPLQTGTSPGPSRQQINQPLDIFEPRTAPAPASQAGFIDAIMAMDILEDLPPTPAPPRTTINPSLLIPTPMIHLPMHYEPSFASLLETKDPIPEPSPSELTADPLLAPLVSPYAATFYPLPPEKTSKKRKAGNKRTTVSGAPVVDLGRWEAIMNVNPAARLARRSTKCINTREWEIMYHEIRYLKALGKIQELKMAGRWSFRQPKKQRGPTIYKTHWDYLLDEMKWLQTDFREERRWKITVAMELAYAAAEWVHADNDGKKALTSRYAKIDVDEANEDPRDAERIDAEMTDVDGPSAPKRRRLSSPLDEMDIDEDLMATAPQQPAVRPRRTIASLSRSEEDEEEEEEEEDDYDDDDDGASLHSVVHQAEASASAKAAQQSSTSDTAVLAGPTPAELIGEMERNKDVSGHAESASRPVADIGSPPTDAAVAGVIASQIPAGSEVDGDGEPEDEDMDAEGEADDENGSGARSAASAATPAEPSQPSVIAKTEQSLAAPDVEAPPRDESTSRRSQSVTGSGNNKKGLKAGHEDVAMSSVAGSLLDPKLLRGPILDLGLEEFVVDLSDLFNQGLAIEDRVPDADKDDITLASLFPELSLYEFTEPPRNEVNEKKERRVDESGMTSGRLTYTTRLMDSKNVLLSTLQPGMKYRQGRWDDPSDAPVAEEPRDYSKASPDIIPPAAPMFCGTKAKDHVHPIHIPNLLDPHDTEYRLMQFVWTNEEDQLLKALYNQFGQNWQLIADVFNSSRITIPTDVRAAWDCLRRWKALQGEDKSTDGNSSKPDAPDLHPSVAAMTRYSTAAKAAAAASPAKKLPLQITTARNAGGRRPMRHSIVFEVIKKLISKRASKPPVKARSTQSLHDTHLQVAQQKHLTPQELARLKFERDQQIANTQLAQVQLQRKAEAARQMSARASQMQLPNIAQQQRLGMPGAPNGLGAGQASGRPPLTPAQQQTALLQLQQRAQHLQNNPQMQAYAAMTAQNAAANQNAASQNGQSASPPPHSSPHPGAAVPNGRPPSATPMGAGSPQLGQLTAAQVQAAALAYNRAASGSMPPGVPLPAGLAAQGIQVDPSKNGMLQQLLWQQRQAHVQQAQQAQLVQQAAAAAAHSQSSSPHIPNANPGT